MYQAGFAIFSSTEAKLHDLEVCFIATSKIIDWHGIQIGTFSHFNHTKILVPFSDLCRQPLSTCSRAACWEDVLSFVCDIF